MCGCNSWVCARTNRMRLNQSISATYKDKEQTGPGTSPLPVGGHGSGWRWLLAHGSLGDTPAAPAAEPTGPCSHLLRGKGKPRGAGIGTQFLGVAGVVSQWETPRGWVGEDGPLSQASQGALPQPALPGHQRRLREGHCTQPATAGAWVEAAELCHGSQMGGARCRHCVLPSWGPAAATLPTASRAAAGQAPFQRLQHRPRRGAAHCARPRCPASPGCTSCPLRRVRLSRVHLSQPSAVWAQGCPEVHPPAPASPAVPWASPMSPRALGSPEHCGWHWRDTGWLGRDSACSSSLQACAKEGARWCGSAAHPWLGRTVLGLRPDAELSAGRCLLGFCCPIPAPTYTNTLAQVNAGAHTQAQLCTHICRASGSARSCMCACTYAGPSARAEQACRR